jgi:acetyltransferase
VVSLGDKVDVDFGDCLDYFAVDRATRRHPALRRVDQRRRKFMSARPPAAGRAGGVIKSGRHAQGAQGRRTHTGALAGSTRLRRPPSAAPASCACSTSDELFAAAETLGRQRPFSGDRLAVSH